VTLVSTNSPGAGVEKALGIVTTTFPAERRKETGNVTACPIVENTQYPQLVDSRAFHDEYAPESFNSTFVVAGSLIAYASHHALFPGLLVMMMFVPLVSL